MIPSRLLLAIMALAMFVVGAITAHNPPAYLAWPQLWAVAALGAAFACLLALSRNTRQVCVAGALVVALAAARAAAISVGVLFGDVDRSLVSPYQTGIVVWLVVAILSWETWHWHLVPWSLFKQKPVSDAN